MRAAFLYAQAGLRGRWRSWLGVALIAALSGGAVLALAAGARRTESAYPRFLRAHSAPDLLLFVGGAPPQLAALRHLPQAVQTASLTGLATADADVEVAAPDDARFGSELSRFKFLSGRRPRPDRPDEAAVSFLAARARHLKVGGTITVHLVGGGPHGAGIRAVTFRVVGVEAAAGEFPPLSGPSSLLPVYVSPAFLRTAAGAAAAGAEPIAEIALRLRGGRRDTPAAVAAAERTINGPVGSEVLADQTETVQGPIRQQAAGLWFMAGFAALAATLVLSQVLVRQIADVLADGSTLQALGMARAELTATAALQVAAAALAAAVGAVLVASAASPLLPLGTARIAEPHPGVAFDAVVLGPGGAAVLVLVGALGTALAILHRQRSGRISRHRTAERYPPV